MAFPIQPQRLGDLPGQPVCRARASTIPPRRHRRQARRRHHFIDVVDGNIQPSFTVKRSKEHGQHCCQQHHCQQHRCCPANFEFSLISPAARERWREDAGGLRDRQICRDRNSVSAPTGNTTYADTTQPKFLHLELRHSVLSRRALAPEVTPEDLARYVGAGNPTTYISDVTYYRIYYMLIESTSLPNGDERLGRRILFPPVLQALPRGGLQTSCPNWRILRSKCLPLAAKRGPLSGRSAFRPELHSRAAGGKLDITTGKPVSFTWCAAFTTTRSSASSSTLSTTLKECTPTMTVGAPPYTAHWAGLSSTFIHRGGIYA